MKTRKGFKSIAVIVTLIFGLTLSGCNEPAPFANDDTAMEAVAGSQTGLRFIPFAKMSGSLHKIYTATSYVTYADGGKLSLDYDGDYEFEAELKVPAQSISQDAELSMIVDDESFVLDFDVTFQPHGITFSQPALLTIEADGLDLTNVDPATVGLYYDNPETGTWEQMEVGSITVDVLAGKVRVKDAKLPHFSRYALGSE